MELFAEMIRTLWQQLDTAEVPILEITFKEFLVGVLILKCIIDILNFFLGKVTSPVTKTSIEDGTKPYVDRVDWRAVRSARNRDKMSGGRW